MRKTIGCSLIATVAVAGLLAGAATAAADPIHIAGVVTGNPTGPDETVNFSTLWTRSNLQPGFYFNVNGGSTTFGNEVFLGDPGFSFASCMPCAVGESISLSSHFTAPLGVGTAVIDGHTFSSVYYGMGEFDFQTASTVVPNTRSDYFDINLPFTFRGDFFTGYSDASLTTPLFTADLTGSGAASVTLRRQRGSDGTPMPLFNTESLQFSFITPGGTDPAPVPEPATMSLLGLGLAGLGARRFRRRNPSPQAEPRA